jgi:NDP-sugar pyrophosphorylase family protein
MPPVALLAGGLATRLHPVTRTVPKAMLEVAGEPFIKHQAELLQEKGVERIVVCAGYLGEQIRDYLGKGERLGLAISYSFDGERLLGTGGALRNALPLLGDLFWVTYGDSYLDTDYAAILDYFLSHDKPALMAVYKNKGRWDKSNIVFAEGMALLYDKKTPQPDMQYIDYGLALLRKEAVERIPTGEIFDLADLYKKLVDQREMLAFEVRERFYEIGSFAGLKETSEYIAGRKKQSGG